MKKVYRPLFEQPRSLPGRSHVKNVTLRSLDASKHLFASSNKFFNSVRVLLPPGRRRLAPPASSPSPSPLPTSGTRHRRSFVTFFPPLLLLCGVLLLHTLPPPPLLEEGRSSLRLHFPSLALRQRPPTPTDTHLKEAPTYGRTGGRRGAGEPASKTARTRSLAAAGESEANQRTEGRTDGRTGLYRLLRKRERARSQVRRTRPESLAAPREKEKRGEKSPVDPASSPEGISLRRTKEAT